jgi:hypothetical protein
MEAMTLPRSLFFAFLSSFLWSPSGALAHVVRPSSINATHFADRLYPLKEIYGRIHSVDLNAQWIAIIDSQGRHWGMTVDDETIITWARKSVLHLKDLKSGDTVRLFYTPLYGRALHIDRRTL